MVAGNMQTDSKDPAMAGMPRAGLSRCRWAQGNALLAAYHDAEWGVPERDPRALWEKLMLDGFQAGLAWITILRKRDAFRAAFAGFEPDIVARFGEPDIATMLDNAGIVRSRAKIVATIGNARAYLAMRDAGHRVVNKPRLNAGILATIGQTG